MKLSIIIPCYNAEPYIDELMKILMPQVTPDVEVIVVDDGSKFPYLPSFPGVKVFRKENGGVSSARNFGLDRATGEYIAFIDDDDMVADNYILTILHKIDSEHFDYCYLSWKTFGGGWTCNIKINTIEDKFPPYNKCVWNRIYRKDMIGDVRFNEKKQIAEDAQFIREVNEKGRKKAVISEYMYFYRTGHSGNLTERFNRGEIDFSRTVYHYNHITADMTWLIDDVKKVEEDGEAIILTNQNDIPELEEIAMVLPPRKVPGTDFKGEPTPLFVQLPKAIRTQVIIWKHFLITVGGIETWIYNFCNEMREYYDIIVLYDKIDPAQLIRLSKIVRCVQNNPNQRYTCDTFIINQLNDELPENVTAKHRIRLTHTCRIVDFKLLTVPKDCDHNFYVSETARDTFGETGEVILNMPGTPPNEKALFLLSATRLTPEKGWDRMVKLAELLSNAKMPFVWMVFTADRTHKYPPNIIRMDATLDIYPYLRLADYVVQLSDTEAFCYTIQEALQVGTPVIATPLPILKEFGVADGKNGYIVPFDMQDIDVQKFRKIPKVKYNDHKEDIISQWREVLGDTVPKHDYSYDDSYEQVICTRRYRDVVLNRSMTPGETQMVTRERANSLVALGVCRIL